MILDADITTVKSAIEIQERIADLARELSAVYNKSNDSPILDDAEKAAKIMIPLIGNIDHEVIYVLNLDVKNRLIRLVHLYTGTVSAVAVRSAEVFRLAVIDMASSIILVHNHPSGDTEPSIEDIQLTTVISKAGKILGIELLDHLIVSENGFLSMREHGLGFQQ